LSIEAIFAYLHSIDTVQWWDFAVSFTNENQDGIMRLALVQMNATPDREENVERACRHIEKAADGGADLVVIPEFFNIAYPFYRQSTEIYALAESMEGPSVTRVREAAAGRGVNLIATIYEKEAEGVFFDTSFVFDRSGGFLGRYSKVHPAGPKVSGMERLYYRGGTRFPVFTIDDWKIGISICYDWRFPETARCLTVNGAEIVIMPFASPYTAIWDKGVPFRAWENSIYTATCNHVGQEEDTFFPGDSMVSDPYGEIIAHAGNEEQVIYADLIREVLAEAHAVNGVLRDRRPEVYTALTTPMDRLRHD